MNFLTTILAQLADRYPGCWQLVDKIRERRNKQLPDWPAYCFIPFLAARDIVSAGKKLSYLEFASKGNDMARLATLATWRVTQRIYRFHDALFDELWETPITKIPPEIFHKLPEWCVYIETPKPQYRGVFVQVEYNIHKNRDELRLLFDKIDGGLDDTIPMLLPLDKEDLLEAFQSLGADLIREFQKEGISCQINNDAIGVLGNVISVVLYLCSVNADYERAEQPIAKRTKRGVRLFPPPAPEIIDVGIRVGAALKRGIQSLSSDDSEEPDASVRPHVRRAHWHHYWIGPKTDQELILKWLSPILVNINKGEIETTIRPVES